jgi:hypothetical protein
MFQLATFERPIPGLGRPIVLLVDCVNHRIERPTIDRSEIEKARRHRPV